jgi:hypothetical protein
MRTGIKEIEETGGRHLAAPCSSLLNKQVEMKHRYNRLGFGWMAWVEEQIEIEAAAASFRSRSECDRLPH